MREGLQSHWKVLLGITVVALIGLRVLEPDYNELQTATDAATFRDVLVHPGRAMGAALCDVVFAVGYGALGVVLFCILGGRARVATLGAIAIAATALFDELENLLVIGNIARHQTTTDGWIDAMRVVGTVKWSGVVASVLLLVAVLITRLFSARRASTRGAD